MNNHKLLTKLAVITTLLLGVGTVGANTNVQTVNAAKTHRKGKYIKDFCVYHVRKGIKHWAESNYDENGLDFTIKLWKLPEMPVNAKEGTNTIIAPTNTKQDLHINGTIARPMLNRWGVLKGGGWMYESEFKKTFAKGGTFNDGLIHMHNHTLYKGLHRLSHNDIMNATTVSERIKKDGYKNIKHYKTINVLSLLQNDDIDPSNATGEDKDELDKCVAELKRIGYPEAKIKEILDFQTYRMHYEDTHDDYDIPYLINTTTLKSKFFLY